MFCIVTVNVKCQYPDCDIALKFCKMLLLFYIELSVLFQILVIQCKSIIMTKLKYNFKTLKPDFITV